MMRCLICSFFLSVFISCGFNQPEKPSLSDEKLARVMADLSIAEAATIGLEGYPKDSLVKVYFAQVFEIHGTTQDAYEKDLRIVSTDMPRLKEIVDASIKLLGGEEGSAPQ